MRGTMNVLSVISILCVACLVFFLSCQNKSDHALIESSMDKLDSSDFLAMGDIYGSIDYELLIGEWELLKFAYTADGNLFSDMVDIPISPDFDIKWIASQNGISIDEAIYMLKPKLQIPNPPITPPEDEWYFWDDLNEYWVENSVVLWRLYVCNASTWICSLSDNIVNLKLYSTTKMGCSNSAESDIMFALSNACSFVIRDNELLIFFSGIEKLDNIQKKEFTILKNHNLLILKKL